MNLFKHSGFTLVELLISIVIIGLLGNISAQSFQSTYKQTKYEKFIFTIQHYTQEARNKAIINEAEYNTTTSKLEDPTGYGVEIINLDPLKNYTMTLRLFQDIDKDGLYNNLDKELKVFTETKVLNVDSFTGILAESNNTDATTFTKVTLSFQPDPDPIAQIQTATENLRSLDLKFSHIRKDGSNGLRKKFTFDTISKISEINDYPILVDVKKIDNITLEITSNEPLQNADPTSTFSITQEGADIGVTGGSINNKIITLTTAPFITNDPLKPLKIIYNTNPDIKTSSDNIILQARQLELVF